MSHLFLFFPVFCPVNRIAYALLSQNHRVPTLMSVYIRHDLRDTHGSYSRSGPVFSYRADKLAEDAWRALCRPSKGRDAPIDWCVCTYHVQYYMCTVSVMCVQCLSCVCSVSAVCVQYYMCTVSVMCVQFL